jgi:hypothetical protein
MEPDVEEDFRPPRSAGSRPLHVRWLAFGLFALAVVSLSWNEAFSSALFLVDGVLFVAAGLSQLAAFDEGPQWLANSFARDQRKWGGWGILVFGILVALFGTRGLWMALHA